MFAVFTRRKSEAYPSKFIPSHEIEETESTDTRGVFQIPGKRGDFRFLVRVGGGFQAFTKISHAATYYAED